MGKNPDHVNAAIQMNLVLCKSILCGIGCKQYGLKGSRRKDETWNLVAGPESLKNPGEVIGEEGTATIAAETPEYWRC